MAEQDMVSQKAKDAEFIFARIGLPAAICLLLGYVLMVQLNKMQDKLAWKLDRTIRNERAIMQKLGIPVILDGEQDK